LSWLFDEFRRDFNTLFSINQKYSDSKGLKIKVFLDFVANFKGFDEIV